MLRHRHIERICCVIFACVVLITALYMAAAAGGWITADSSIGYEKRLFDQSRVHTIDLVMNDWEGFLATAMQEEYAACTLVIDGEKFTAAIRAKGNTSLSSVQEYGNSRYSFKVEFDHYQSDASYYGLDKLSLNNLIQDNTYLKDYVSYTLMGRAGVAAPLCSFVQVNVNGEPWGLYLAVEAVEDAFLLRNYGKDHGDLYKPDSLSFGGGRGNGRDFDMNEAMENFGPGAMEQRRGGMGGMGSDDVKLLYSDDDPASYSNIFDNAKTDVSDLDKTRLIASLKALSEGDTSVVDTASVLRYMAVHHFLCNDDSYTGQMIHNYYLYEENGVLAMIPWDYNLAMGGFSGGNAAGTINGDVDELVSGGGGDRPMADWITASEASLAAYHDAYAAFVADTFDSGWFAAEIDRVVAMIAPYVERDPTAFCTYEEFTLAAETLKQFCLKRAESVSLQLAGEDAQVDASGIDLSVMGGMNKGGFGGNERFGGGRGDFGGGRGFGRNNTDAGANTASTDGARPAGDTPPQLPDGAAIPDMNGAVPPGGMPQAAGDAPPQMPDGAAIPDMNGAVPPGGMPHAAGDEAPQLPDGAAIPDMNGAVPPGGMPQAAGDEAPQLPDGAAIPDMSGAIPPGGMASLDGMQLPERGGGAQPSAGGLWLLAGSVAILAAAILLVMKYRGHS